MRSTSLDAKKSCADTNKITPTQWLLQTVYEKLFPRIEDNFRWFHHGDLSVFILGSTPDYPAFFKPNKKHARATEAFKKMFLDKFSKTHQFNASIYCCAPGAATNESGRQEQFVLRAWVFSKLKKNTGSEPSSTPSELEFNPQLAQALEESVKTYLDRGLNTYVKDDIRQWIFVGLEPNPTRVKRTGAIAATIKISDKSPRFSRKKMKEIEDEYRHNDYTPIFSDCWLIGEDCPSIIRPLLEIGTLTHEHIESLLTESKNQETAQKESIYQWLKEKNITLGSHAPKPTQQSSLMANSTFKETSNNSSHTDQQDQEQKPRF